MNGLAFKRMYVDLPVSTHEQLVELAKERGTSQKGLVAELIEDACNTKPKPARKKRSKKRGS